MFLRCTLYFRLPLKKHWIRLVVVAGGCSDDGCSDDDDADVDDDAICSKGAQMNLNSWNCLFVLYASEQLKELDILVVIFCDGNILPFNTISEGPITLNGSTFCRTPFIMTRTL